MIRFLTSLAVFALLLAGITPPVVHAVPPVIDVMTLPVLPEIPPEAAAALRDRVQASGKRIGAFAKVGDDALDSPDFLVPFATEGGDLGDYAALQTTIDFYRVLTVHDDPAITSLNADSRAAGPGYTFRTLAEPDDDPACEYETVLGCEFRLTWPAVALISFGAVLTDGLTPAQLDAELQVLVAECLGRYGVIPVLATLPPTDAHTLDQLAPYNTVIVQAAAGAQVPLWNLARAMVEHGVRDPNSVAPGGAAIFSPGALAYGMNVRNLTALQVLAVVLDQVFPDASAAPPVPCAVTADQAVNVRIGPGVGYTLLGNLPAGEAAAVQAQTTDAEGFTWWRLDSGHWVRGDLVWAAGDCAQVPVAR